MKGYINGCFHCWHSDPNTHGRYRWYCCRKSCMEVCLQNYLDVRRCKSCGLKMFLDVFGMCPLCGVYIQKWILERVQSDTIGEHRGVIVEYLAAAKLPDIQSIRAALSLGVAAQKQLSTHLRHKRGSSRSTRKIRKIQRNRARQPGWHGHHPEQKPRDKWSRQTINDIPDKTPSQDFWDLFDRVLGQQMGTQ